MAAKNSLTKYFETTLSVNEAVTAMLNNKDINYAVITDEVERERYNANAEQVLHEPALLREPTTDVDIDEYFRKKRNTWFMPDKYKNINIEDYCVALCPTQFCVDRVMEELELYEKMGLEDVLRFLIYLVDYLRENKIVWGVGRGSSVASYVLYLIGVHKINSLEYKLDVKEFLK